MIIGETSGKLLLFGEHAAVYGFPALGLSLDQRARIEWKETDASPSFPSLSESNQKLAQALLSHLQTSFPCTKTLKGEFYLESNIPESSGFGSSAAICSSLAQILLNWVERNGMVPRVFFENTKSPPPPSEIDDKKLIQWFIANTLEQFFHGTASGIDTGLSIYSGINAVFPQANGLPKIQSLKIRNLRLVIGALPRRRNTKELVQEIQRGMIAGDPQVVKSINTLGLISTEAIELFNGNINEKDFFDQIKDKIIISQKNLKKLGLSTKDLDRTFKQARDLGASASKLSGAGGGGAFFHLLPENLDSQQFMKQLTLSLQEQDIELLVPMFQLEIK